MDLSYEVMKFGGSCLSAAEDYENAAKIISMYTKPAVVVSAMKGITEELLELSEMTELTKVMEKISNIQSMHMETAEKIKNPAARTQAAEEIRKLFRELNRIVVYRKGRNNREVKPLILSYGEKLSSVLMKWYLASNDIPASEIFANEVIVSSDENILEATADESKSRDLLIQRLSTLMTLGRIPVITGFFCRTPSGKTAILGRNSSDYTAALVSASLKGSSLTFWKDVPGLMTGDPKFVKNCRILREIGYDEAASFISNGAKILHSKVISLSRENNVPIRIRDFRNPEDMGTLISGTPECKPSDFMNPAAVQNLFSM